MVTVGGMDGKEIQSAIDELTSPILTAIVIPAMEFGPVNGNLRSVNNVTPNDNGPCLPIRS